MKAVVLQGNKGASVVNDRPTPKLRPDYVLVDTKAVALNPTDWKHREYDATNFPGLLSGCDYAGVVEEVGANVDKPWKKGDRICGFVQYVFLNVISSRILTTAQWWQSAQ